MIDPHPNAATQPSQTSTATTLTSSVKLLGIAAATGIGVGTVKVPEKLPELTLENLTTISAKQAEKELRKLDEAFETASSTISAAQVRTDSEEQSSILELQLMFLQDKGFRKLTSQLVSEGSELRDIVKNGIPDNFKFPEGSEKVYFSAASAIQIATAKNAARMRTIPDPYMAARVDDFEVLGKILLSILDHKSPDFLKTLNRRGKTSSQVIVAKHLLPAEAACINKKNCAGIITEQGTLFDHTAIVAKALGLPYVIGVDVEQIPADAELVVDGYSGEIIINPTEVDLTRLQGALESLENSRIKLPIKQRAPMTKDGTLIRLMATMDFADQAKEIKDLRAQGIGLVRTEMELLRHGSNLTEDAMFEAYSELLKNFSPEPVVLRIFDIGADKLQQSTTLSSGENPALGFRGVRVLLNPEYEESHLIPQLRAILRASKFGQAHILIPMVNDAGEIKKIREILDKVRAQLHLEGFETGEFIKLGAMIETPAASYSAFQIMRQTDFTNLGTNDLTQYTLAIDRNNPLVSHGYAPHHPAMIETYRRIAKSKSKVNAERADEMPKRCVICGDSASNQLLLPIFIGLGFRAFSVAPAKIEELNHTFSLLDVDRCKALVESLRDLDTGAQDAEEVYARLQEFQASLNPA